MTKSKEDLRIEEGEKKCADEEYEYFSKKHEEELSIYEIINAQESLEWILNKWGKDITHIREVLGRVEAAEYLLRKFLKRKGIIND